MSQAPCPHCGETLRDLWDWGWKPYMEEEAIDVECGWCEEPIRITRRVDISYVIDRRENENVEEATAAT